MLRQLSIDDEQAIFALRTDPKVNQYLDRQPCSSNEEALNFINKINAHIEKGDVYYWAITLTATKKLVGTICLFDFSNENGSCEIGYELMPQYQGQGIMKEAIEAVINYVFDVLKLKKILALTHYQNQASTNVLLKFNFVKSSTPDQENPDLIMFSLTR